MSLFVLTTLLPLAGTAQNVFWKTTVKSGSYSDTNNWTGGVVPSPSATAYFGTGTNSYNVTLDVSTNAGGIRVDDGAYVTLTIAAGQTYTLGSGGVYLRGSALYHPANPVPGKPGSVLHVVGGTFTNSGGALIGDAASKYGTLVLDGGIGFFQSLTVSSAGAYGHLRVINKSTLVSQAADIRHEGLILLEGASTWSQIANNSYMGSQGGHDASLVITNGSSYKIVGGGMYIGGDIVNGTGRVYVAGSGSSYSGRVAVSEYALYSKGVGFFTVGDGAVVYGDKFNAERVNNKGLFTETLKWDLELQTVREGYDRKTGWFQPRIGIMPGGRAVLTLTRNQLWGSDIFSAVNVMYSGDLGRTWSDPEPQPRLDRHTLPDGFDICPCDMTPAWHAASGRLLATGHTAIYSPGPKGHVAVDNLHRRELCYAAYDPKKGTWSEWKILEYPDPDAFFWAGAGCTQRVDLPNGESLIPVSVMSKAAVGSNFWKACFATTVLRVSFDGETMRYLGHGDFLSVPEPRGLYESSLTLFKGRYYLTMRNDQRGYVAVGDDGLHFGKPVAWAFDDGAELGSYNTQQHWVTHSDGLFLSYTRRGADNDEIVRHRAPLFLAQVDPERLCVVRSTERVVVPKLGAQLGNFGTVNASVDESWIVTSECMQGDAKNTLNLELTERRGGNNRIYIARIKWGKANLNFQVK
jgi:hypothetical protein